MSLLSRLLRPRPSWKKRYLALEAEHVDLLDKHDEIIRAYLDTERIAQERDRYKPFHDALIDTAVVSWTYEHKDEEDYDYAIKKLIAQQIQYAADPAICEERAKLEAERDDYKRRLDAVVEMLHGTWSITGSEPLLYQRAVAIVEDADLVELSRIHRCGVCGADISETCYCNCEECER